jgi:predicted small secreted protein
MNQIKPIVILSLAAVSAALSSSCATTKGFGQDLQKLGSRVEDRANATGGAEPDRKAPAAPTTAPGTPSAY